MNFVLFDDAVIRVDLLPLTLTRPVSFVRVGIFTIAEKWEYFLKQPVFIDAHPYLQKKFHKYPSGSDIMFINGAVCPNDELLLNILALQPGEVLVRGQVIVASHGQKTNSQIEYKGKFKIIEKLWDIFLINASEILADFGIIQSQRKSCVLTDPHTRVYNIDQIFIEEGVIVKAAIINAEDGPVYLGRNAVVNEGVIIKGPFSLGEGAQLTMGAKMRGDSTIGPYCKVGGEVSNSILFGYSNKGHDGFIGNTIIGEWCNLGADTNTSNLKNNYGEVELYNYREEKFVKTGRQFCGLVMGDHSKCGINTMFNTGTVVGVSANIFGGGFPPKFIPSFSWGGAEGFSKFNLEKSFEVATAVMSRRNLSFTQADKEIFTDIYYDNG